MAKREIEGQKEFLKVLWSQLVQKHLEPVIFRHVDMFTKGHPDSSVNANSKTIWFEFKRWDGVLSPAQEDNARKIGNLWVITFLTHDEVRADCFCPRHRVIDFHNYIDAAIHFSLLF